MPPIWNSKCPQGLYQDSKTSDRPVGETRDSSSYLFGRFFAYGFHRRNSIIPCHLGGHPCRSVRICGELPKIPTKSYTVNRVSGFPYKFSYTKHQPPVGQSKKYQKRVSESCGKSRHHDKRASSAPGEIKCFNPAVFPAPLHYRHIQAVKKRSLALHGGYESQVCWTTEALEELKWWRDHLSAWNGPESNFTEPSSTDNRDRCLHSGMGSMLWKFSDQRPLVSVRKVTTHKLSRTSGRRVCPEILSEKQVQYPCKTNEGQYNSNKLYKQNGWANIIGPVKPSLRPLVMVSRTVHNSRSTPFARAIKYCGRFRISGSSRYQRLVTGSVHISGNQQQVGPLHNRSFCKQTDGTASQICELEARSRGRGRGRGSGCLYSGLEPAQGICIPSICPKGWCLRQVLRQSVSQLTIVAPVWETQPWYPLLLEMTVDHPILLPSFPGLLRQQNELHPFVILQLAAWLVSGVNMKVQQFHSQLKDCFWLHGEPGQKKLFLQPGESGLVGVVNDKSIPFQRL